MAPNLLWAADLTYINLIRRKRPGPDPRPRLRADQKRGPQASPHCLRPRAGGKPQSGLSNNTGCSAKPVSPLPQVSPSRPPQHLYSHRLYSRRWHAAPTPAHSTHEFFKASGNLLRGSQKTAGRKVLANFPSGHAMSSRRLFLSGLLSSRARLRFAGVSILPNSKSSPPAITRFANRGIAKALAPAHCYWHNRSRTRAGFSTLESPDRCLKDRVNLKLLAPDELDFPLRR